MKCPLEKGLCAFGKFSAEQPHSCRLTLVAKMACWLLSASIPASPFGDLSPLSILLFGHGLLDQTWPHRRSNPTLTIMLALPFGGQPKWRRHSRREQAMQQLRNLISLFLARVFKPLIYGAILYQPSSHLCGISRTKFHANRLQKMVSPHSESTNSIFSVSVAQLWQLLFSTII